MSPFASLVDPKAKGLSLRAIAAEMNARGTTTSAAMPWNPMAVRFDARGSSVI